MATKKRKKAKKRSGGIASFTKAVNSNKALKSAIAALKKAEARKKAARKKAIAIAKKKLRSRKRR